MRIPLYIFFILISSYLTGQEKKLIKISVEDCKYAYTKEKFEIITDSFPQLNIQGNKIIENPDSAYYNHHVFAGGYTFGSEAGQDEFYVLYAHFLKKKTGKKYNNVRNNLIEIYRRLNFIYGFLNYGGTGFGHLHARILGYAEYDTYIYSLEKGYNKKDNFQFQKDNYIRSLKKMVDTNIAEDTMLTGSSKEQARRTKDMYIAIDKLRKVISNDFYLSKAKEFEFKEYSHLNFSKE